MRRDRRLLLVWLLGYTLWFAVVAVGIIYALAL
jgi:hypothetical protein